MKTTDWTAQIERAAERLRGVARCTPVLSNRELDSVIGAGVVCKDEGRQVTGSFKLRGAWNALAAHPPAALSHGVVTYSSGNFGRALAYAAHRYNTRCLVLAPRDGSAEKLAAIRRAGADVLLYDPHTEDRQLLAENQAREHGLALIPPFDDPHVIAGQGTVARELLGQAPTPDVLIAPVSGGGLLAGCALAAHGGANNRHIKVIGVEPATMPRASLSLSTGARETVPPRPTIADALKVTQLGAVTFPVIERHVEEIVTVNDDELVDAMALAHRYLGARCEPAGAAGLAALLAGRIDTHSRRIGVILSGANISPHRFDKFMYTTDSVPTQRCA
jgi:threonine dehydratase